MSRIWHAIGLKAWRIGQTRDFHAKASTLVIAQAAYILYWPISPELKNLVESAESKASQIQADLTKFAE